MNYAYDIATWPMVLVNATQAGNYGALAGFGLAYYLLGNPLGQGQELMSLLQTYALYGVAVTGGAVAMGYQVSVGAPTPLGPAR